VQNDGGAQPADSELLTLEVQHALPGRLRLRVGELRFNRELATLLVETFAKITGVGSVRANTWCASLIICFDETVTSREFLLAELRKTPAAAGSAAQVPQLPSVPGKVTTLVLNTLHKLETATPPVVQLGLGLAAFASALLGAPATVTTVISCLAILPIGGRAAQTAVAERKFGVDGLDGMAAILMIAQQNLKAASFMAALIGLGEYIRDLTARRCRKIMDDLLGLSGSSAWLVKGNKRVCIPADQVAAGDTVVIYPGELVPVDGAVLRGSASVNQAALTGESIPVEVVTGSEVFAGTYLEQGKIYVRCSACLKDSRAGRVVEMVKAAPVYETRTHNYAAQMADKLVLPILGTAAICGIFSGNLTRVMSVLIFDFSTGIRISAPTAILSSMQRAGRHGILIKNGGAVERLGQVDAIVLDKTGTLTLGEPSVSGVFTLNGFAEPEVLCLAAAVEQRLHHPAARAIVKYARKSLSNIPERTDSEHTTGMGVKAGVNGRHVFCGSRRFMQAENIDIKSAVFLEKEILSRGESVVYVAIDSKLSGLICYADKLRPEVPRVIRRLRKQGIKKIYMATGDHEQAALAIARQAGITDIFSNSFPEQKAGLVKELKRLGHTVAVVGDGINDSPALAHADLGISLHSATNAAQESADVLLTDNDLSRLPEAIDISRQAMRLVRENITFIAIPNGAGIALAAAGIIGPALSTLLNNGSAILAALNSLRPLFFVSQWTRSEDQLKS
jgi:heavy metal translocating P-type ATPase